MLPRVYFWLGLVVLVGAALLQSMPSVAGYAELRLLGASMSVIAIVFFLFGTSAWFKPAARVLVASTQSVTVDAVVRVAKSVIFSALVVLFVGIALGEAFGMAVANNWAREHVAIVFLIAVPVVLALDWSLFSPRHLR